MFTVCPKCSLKLVVTAADLRVAQGYVRCGRCSNVFNALVGLSDEQQAALAREERKDSVPLGSAGSGAATRELPGSQDPPGSRGPPESPETRDSSADDLLSDAALEFDAATTDVSEVFVQPALDDTGATGQSETIILRSEDARLEEPAEGPEPADDSAGPAQSPSDSATGPIGIAQLEPAVRSLEETDEFELADFEPLLNASAGRDAVMGSSGSAEQHDTDASRARRTSDPLEGAAQPQAPEARHDPRVTAGSRAALGASRSRGVSPSAMHDLSARSEPAKRRPGWILGAGSAALVLLLAGQLVNHYRTKLAEIAWLRPPLTAAYAALGMPLASHWNVRAYEVRQLGAVVGPGNPGTLTIRATIENTGPREQPLPLLRVTVQDRFGNRVAARDVPPGAYLPKNGAKREDLAAGQRVDAEIALVDPGPRVVGFEIDACLEDAAQRVSCAHQPRSVR